MDGDRISQLRQMAEDAPADALTWYMLGVELVRASRHGEGAQALEKAFTLDPDHTATLRWLGDAYRGIGDATRARETYRRAVALAERTGELQVAREAGALLRKLDASGSSDPKDLHS